MKKLLVFLLLSIVTYGQHPEVVKIEKIETGGKYYAPHLSACGGKIFFTGEGSNGLYYYDDAADSVVKITGAPGAGINPVIYDNGNVVIYNKDRFIGKRRIRRIVKQEIPSGKLTEFSSDLRAGTPPFRFGDHAVAFKEKENLVIRPVFGESVVIKDSVVYIKNNRILLYINGFEGELELFGEGIYTNPAISPDGKHIAFRFGTNGIYVTDLKGNVILHPENASDYSISPDWKHIAYTVEADDGLKTTSSDIYVQDIWEKSEPVNITESLDVFASSPDWGKDKIAFSTAEGEIYIVHIKPTDN